MLQSVAAAEAEGGLYRASLSSRTLDPGPRRREGTWIAAGWALSVSRWAQVGEGPGGFGGAPQRGKLGGRSHPEDARGLFGDRAIELSRHNQAGPKVAAAQCSAIRNIGGSAKTEGEKYMQLSRSLAYSA